MINARLPFLVDFLIYTLIFTMLCFLFFLAQAVLFLFSFFSFFFFFYDFGPFDTVSRREKKERILETGTFSICKIVPWSRLYL